MAILAADIDDVILPFADDLHRHTKEIHGIDVHPSVFTNYTFAEQWGVSHEQSDQIIMAYCESEEFLNLEPDDETVSQMRRIPAHGHEIKLLTSRHDDIREHTVERLPLLLPDVFTEIHFSSNAHTTRSSGLSKPELLVLLGADGFAEDNLHYALPGADVVPIVYLFRKSWNRNHGGLPSNMIEVDYWQEVADDFLLRF